MRDKMKCTNTETVPWNLGKLIQQFTTNSQIIIVVSKNVMLLSSFRQKFVISYFSPNFGQDWEELPHPWEELARISLKQETQILSFTRSKYITSALRSDLLLRSECKVSSRKQHEGHGVFKAISTLNCAFQVSFFKYEFNIKI